MRLDMFRACRLTLAIALALPLTACIAAPATVPAEHVQAPAATAKVTLRLDGLFNRQSNPAQRTILGDLPEPFTRVTNVRVTVKGPGIPGGAAPGLKAWAPVSVGEAVPATLAIEVPFGVNRVFTVEALNAGGNVLMRLRGAATLTSGGTTTLKLNFLEDAVARVIDELTELNSPQVSAGDLVSPLRTYLQAVSQFDAGTNRFSPPGIAPQFLRAEYLAKTLNDGAYADWRTNDTKREAIQTQLRWPYSSTVALHSGTLNFDWSAQVSSNFEDYHVKIFAPHWFGWSQTHSFANSDWMLDVIGDLPPGKFTAIVFDNSNTPLAVSEFMVREEDLELWEECGPPCDG